MAQTLEANAWLENTVLDGELVRYHDDEHDTLGYLATTADAWAAALANAASLEAGLGRFVVGAQRSAAKRGWVLLVADAQQ